MAKKKTDLNASRVNNKKVKPEEIKTDEPIDPPSPPSAYTMFARKKDRGFVAMTEQASMRSDELAAQRKTQPLKPTPNRVTSCIHKIKDE